MSDLALRRHVTVLGWRLRVMYPLFRRYGDTRRRALREALAVEYVGVSLIYCRRCVREGKA